MNGFLTLRQAAQHLELTEDELLQLIHNKQIAAYHLGGQYVRLRFKDVEQLKQSQTTANSNDPELKEQISKWPSSQRQTPPWLRYWLSPVHLLFLVLIAALVGVIVRYVL